MKNLSKEELEFAKFLKDESIFIDVDSKKINTPKEKGGEIMVICSDGDQFSDMYGHRMAESGTMDPLHHRIHIIALAGGPLLLAPASPIYHPIMIDQIHGALTLKCIPNIVLYGHAPCGAPSLVGTKLNIKQMLRLLIQGKEEIEKTLSQCSLSLPKVTITCYFHVDNGEDKRTYEIDLEKWKTKCYAHLNGQISERSDYFSERLTYIEKNFHIDMFYQLLFFIHLYMYTLPDVQDHVTESTFPIQHALRAQCIDGRYNRTDNQACSIPGADGGQLKVMIAVTKILTGKAELHNDEMTKLAEILTHIVGGTKHLAFHTDTHALHDHGIGCGHLKLGKNNPDNYNLTSTEVHFVLDFMHHSIEHGAINIVLDGDHAEKGVIIVDSPTQSIHNKDQNGNQVFIFHKTCAENRNALIAEKIIENGLIEKSDLFDVTELLNQTMEEHLNTTAAALAPGLPIFLVSIDENGTDISEIGTVA